MKRILITLICLFFMISCGDVNTGTPVIPEPIPVPEPTNCCPDATALRCGDCTDDHPCLTEVPDVSVICTGNLYAEPSWNLRIKWGNAYIDVSKANVSCCPILDTGITVEECNTFHPCPALYAGGFTGWSIWGNAEGNWYINNAQYGSFKILRKLE